MVQNMLEKIIFAARWLLAPLYLGLIGALILLVYRYIAEFVTLVQGTFNSNREVFTLDLLGLLDLVLLGNLVLIILFAGYENFVSVIDAAKDSPDRPDWMGKVNFSGLKLKLIGSLVALSVIELLRDFLQLSEKEDQNIGQGLIWRLALHLTFVISGVLFSVMDRISETHPLFRSPKDR
jgi:uncharacterized protein (TIGR00645 family)